MAITDKEEGVWSLDEVYNKQNQGGIWSYTGQSELWMVGRNNVGQLGQNSVGSPSNNGMSSPVQLSGTTWKYNLMSPLAAEMGALIKTNGTLWTWGKNENGELGLDDRGPGNSTARSSPTQVGTDTTWANGSVRGHQEGCMASKTDGTFWIWGRNSSGSLGLNTPGGRSSPCQLPGSDWPTTNEWDAQKMCAGSTDKNFVIKTDGTLWSWGSNGYGALAHNQPNPSHRSSPIQVGTDTTWLSVSGGQSVSALKTDGTLWVWGDNSRGQLGLNQNSGQYAGSYAKSSPTQVGTETNYSQISTGQKGQWAIKTDGTLWGWGENGFGQLGQNQAQSPSNDYNRSSPVQVGTNTNWQQVQAGADMTIALKTDGTLWSWGSNQTGSLGLNENDIYYSSPTQIPGTNWITGIKNNSNGWAAFKEI